MFTPTSESHGRTGIRGRLRSAHLVGREGGGYNAALPDMEPSDRHRLVRRRAAKIAKAAFAVVLLALVYRLVDVDALRKQFGELRTGWPWAMAFLGLLAVNTLISAAKWSVLLRADGIFLPLRTLVGSYLVGSFFNLFLPSSIGGDVYRIADVGRRSKRSAHTAASILFDRLTGFLSIAIYGSLFYVVALRGGWIRPGLRDCVSGSVSGVVRLRGLLYAGLPATAFAALVTLLLLLLWERPAMWLVRLSPPRARAAVDSLLAKIRGSVQAYMRAPGALAMSVVASFWFQANVVLAIYALSRSLHLGLPLEPFWFFVPFISLLEMIPISVFGLGLRDFGYQAFLLSAGMAAGVAGLSDESSAAAAAAALSVLYVALTVLYVSSGGVVYLARSLREPTGDAGTPSVS